MSEEVTQAPQSRSVTVLLLAIGVASAGTALLDIAVGGGLLVMGIAAAVVAGLCLAATRGRLRARPDGGRIALFAGLAAMVMLPAFFASQFFLLMLPQYAGAIVSGPNVVLSARSPDGEFEAYVIDEPCLDGPAQVLYVERNDRLHFIQIADLPEDIDSVQRILWSPMGDVVVFETRFALYVANVPTYETVKIPLGIEWSRSRPGRRSTFSTGGPRRSVAAIEFPEPGVIRYRLSDEPNPRTLRMCDL